MKNMYLMLAGMLITFAVMLLVGKMFDARAVVQFNESLPLLCCGFGMSVASLCTIGLLRDLRRERKEERELRKEKA